MMRVLTSALAVIALLVLTPATAAVGVPVGTIGSFPTFTVAPSATPGQTFSGSVDFTAAVAAPAVTVTTNSSTVRTPTGESAFLGATTGFGQYFGSTRSQPYLYLSPAAGGVPSTTTITFTGPPPFGWGFAVGDIDADFVEVIPRDAGGAQLPGSSLGAQDTDGTPLLNYCNNLPKPSSCAGAGPFTDSPFWFENGTAVGVTTYSTPIVLGNGVDTSGAYDWFLPDATVRSIDLVFHVRSGFPIYQLWLAATAPLTTISGTITTADATPPPSGTTLLLERPDGSPVLDIEDLPIATAVEADGSFEIPAETGAYQLEVVVPAGFAPIPPIQVPLDGAVGTVVIAPTIVAPAPSAGPTSPPTSPPGSPELAASGADDPTLAAVGLALTLTGTLLLLLRRRQIARSLSPTATGEVRSGPV